MEIVRCPLYVTLTALCYSLLFFSACYTGTADAPVEPPGEGKKKEAPPTFVGDSQMTWGDGQGDVTFFPGGGYFCLWQGEQWSGKWSLCANGKKLTVNETSQLGVELSWTVQLKACLLDGECSCYDETFPFRLEKKNKRKKD